MAGYVHHCFSDEERYNPRFNPIKQMNNPSQPIPSPWERQLRKAVRIDPEPDDLIAFRDWHPDIKHPLTPDFISIF